MTFKCIQGVQKESYSWDCDWCGCSQSGETFPDTWSSLDWHSNTGVTEFHVCGSCTIKINGTRSLPKVKAELPPHLESVAANLRTRYASKHARARRVVVLTNYAIAEINDKIRSLNEDLDIAFDDLLEVLGEMRALRDDVLSWFADLPADTYEDGVRELLQKLESARFEMPDVPQIDELNTFADDEKSYDCGVPEILLPKKEVK